MEIDPRYPIGEYEPKPFAEVLKNEWLIDIRFLPQSLEAALLNLDEAQLQTPYRDGGWTVNQLVHHTQTAISMPIAGSNWGTQKTNPQ